MTRWAVAVVCITLGCARARAAQDPSAPASAADGPCPKGERPMSEHRDLWMRAMEFERRDQWAEAEAALARAEELAPDFANYAFRHAYVLIKLAEVTRDAAPKLALYRRAINPLRRCIEIDPAFAECDNFLGEALLATHQTRGALQHYDAAIRKDPTIGYFYPPYADALIALKLYDAAERVLQEGLRVVPATGQNQSLLYDLYILTFMIEQVRDDKKGMVRAMEHAMAAGLDRPEVLFNLGSTYAILTPPDPRGRELLARFLTETCHGPLASKFTDQCEVARVLVDRLAPNR